MQQLMLPRLSSILLLLGSAYGQQVQITSGLADFQVVQRDTPTSATLHLSGTAHGLNGKALQIRVTGGSKHWKATWKPIPLTSSEGWKATVDNVPVGGPYKVELRVAGSAPSVTVHDVLVGDLWILAGQSNMEGVGDLVNVEPPNPLVHSFDQSDKWDVAKEPLHELPSATDRVHWRKNANNELERFAGAELTKYREQRKKGAGLGLPFAAEMLRRTGVPVGFVPCAHGGTSMAQWDPSLLSKAGDSLYGATYRRFQAVGSKVKGILWYQGESEANAAAEKVFPERFPALVAALRKDFKQPELPFYYVQIGRVINASNEKEWNKVQEDQRLAESNIPNSGMVAAIDFELDDLIHVGTPSLKRLGVRLANLAVRDLFPESKKQLQRGPRLVSVKWIASATPPAGVIRVSFSDVNERLTSEGRIGGFSVHDGSGAAVPIIFKTAVDPADPSSVLLSLTGKLPEGATLHYGYGKDPYCNLRDAADMGVAVFGPVPIGQ